MALVQATVQTTTFEQFVEGYPDIGRYELINGTIVEMLPTGPHEQVVAFLNEAVILEKSRLKLPYFIPKTYLVKAPDDESGYQPDILLLDQQMIASEPFWPKQSIITMGCSIKLVIEVVSTNWRNDYLRKLADYEELGIPEYWIVDYRALGAVRYIGSPKTPVVLVYTLNDLGEYDLRQFKGEDRIESALFPDLGLTVAQIVEAAGTEAE